jgi:hypothetical protein
VTSTPAVVDMGPRIPRPPSPPPFPTAPPDVIMAWLGFFLFLSFRYLGTDSATDKPLADEGFCALAPYPLRSAHVPVNVKVRRMVKG